MDKNDRIKRRKTSIFSGLKTSGEMSGIMFVASFIIFFKLSKPKVS